MRSEHATRAFGTTPLYRRPWLLAAVVGGISGLAVASLAAATRDEGAKARRVAATQPIPAFQRQRAAGDNVPESLRARLAPFRAVNYEESRLALDTGARDVSTGSSEAID
ncbi:MAG: hypothetical protein ACREXY_25120, partial [Gammaproteobacteria bacterium]